MSEKKKISMRASGPEQNTDAEDARSKKRSVHGSEKNESIGLFFRRSQKSIGYRRFFKVKLLKLE